MSEQFPLQRVTINGVRYGVREAGQGPALVLLHGFTGSSLSWEKHVTYLARTRRVIAVDALGHGETDAPASPERYGIWPATRDLLALLDALDARDVALLGYSMGGRLALHTAVAAPERFRALILESASPGIRDAVQRAARVREDEALAASIQQRGVAAFVAYWEALPLFASQASLPASVRDDLRALRLANRPPALANSLRGMGAGTVPPLWERLHELRMPTLLIAGALDGKYARVAEEMASLLPNTVLSIAADAGHTVHLEQPDMFDETVRRFLTVRDGRHLEERGAGQTAHRATSGTWSPPSSRDSR
jgi:2-succinyl-6-hydroxy-2,4-cyclohexadiene-1-carboxylate synthase